ncbi:spore germination protein [Paenisporosarcina indica]|uniref:spore germination protein n=1 Tax=Paenisporosarcina indica TaxID=650093 RepID=UPI001FE2E220|nr:spore germination protein [Paenisporosarcina indica]
MSIWKELWNKLMEQANKAKQPVKPDQQDKEEQSVSIEKQGKPDDVKSQQKAIEGPDPSQQKAIEGPDPSQQKAIEGPDPSQQKAIEGPDPSQQKAIEGPDPSQQKAIEGPKPSQQKAIEGPDLWQQKAIEGPDPSKQKAIEGPDPSQQKAIRGLDPSQQKAIRGLDPTQQKAIRGLDLSQQKAIEDPDPSKQKAKEKLADNQVFVNLNLIKQKLKNIGDAVYKDIQTDEGTVTMIYLSTLVDSKKLLESVTLPITNEIEHVLSTFDCADKNNIDSMVMSIVEGETILYFHQLNHVLKVKTFSPQERAISTSDTETTVIGPQDAFTESLQTNLSMIKRRITQPGLKTVDRIIGKETNTKISIIYVEHLVNDENLKRLEDRIAKVDYPGFFDITMLKQIIEDDPYSPFPQYFHTVRPDSTALWLLDGRIVIAMDNSPNVMVCPTSFLEMFFSPEDFYNRWTTASMLRILRFFGFFITIMLTPMYISTLTYHPGLMPYELLIMLQESRSRVPFPPVIEVLFIELVIEVLRESGSRMPSKIGQTIGIVGGIVIGTAAVEAGLVSNTLIVLVAVSALLSFLMPSFLMSNASRFVRYIFILSAGVFGLFGQMLALAWLFNHLLNLTSLGTPYMTPVIPRKMTDLYDGIIRFPLHFIRKTRGIARAKK